MVNIIKNKYAQLMLALIIGVAAGLFLKDTKSIEEKTREETKEKYESILEEERQTNTEELSKLQESITATENSNKEYREETSTKLNIMKTENHKLKQKVTKRKFKLIKPDGTIIEKEFSESDTEKSSEIVTSIREEFNQKISSIENKWKKIHTTRILDLKKKFEEKFKKKKTEIVYKEKIVEKEKIVKINEKKLRSEIGITSDEKVYSHLSYPIWGSFFIGGGGAIDKNFNNASGRIGVGLEL